MQQKSYFYLSGIISFSIYILICVLFLLYINAPKPDKFDSFSKTTVLELELISNKSEEKKVAKKTKKVEQEIVKKSTSKSNKQVTKTAKSLFANVKTKAKKVTPKEVVTTKGSSDPSRYKSKFEKQRKSDNISSEKLLSDIKTTTNRAKTIATAKGKEHPYFSKIKEILWQRWNPRLLEEGLVVKALIIITNSGTFDYRIVKYSKDERFDEQLKNFLDSQKNETFPTHKINTKVDIIINFKSEG